MPFKLVISDPEEGKAIQYELDDAKTNALVGRNVGDIVEGDVLGLPGYKFKITGGSDASGFPIRPDVHGSGKKRILIRGPPGFRSKRKGIAKRKTVRGRELSSNISQVNLRIEEKGSTPLEELVMKVA
ncbi:MAG: 30S ribosomal protein S6e [Candidatus Thorarchaeota archaeon SMTZ1-83]|nr:MAG: 30S ribosomal protein S6 [Candidatus Thorarchaeota archaeon SMTZ1-83]